MLLLTIFDELSVDDKRSRSGLDDKLVTVVYVVAWGSSAQWDNHIQPC